MIAQRLRQCGASWTIGLLRTMCHVRLRCVLGVAVAVLATPAWADDSAARLRAAALVEEGDLLLEEAAGLAPLRERNRAEAERLNATEKKLGAEISRIERDISAYNKAVADLTAEAAEHARACPGDVAAAQVDQCNQRGAHLTERATELDRRKTALAARQRAINEQVDQHNRARAAWMEARRESAPRLDANAADTQRWVNAARSFMATPDFSALVELAGRPSACTQLRLSDASAFFGEQGLKRLHACLKAALRAG